MNVKEMINYLMKMPQDALVVYGVDEEGSAYFPVRFQPLDGVYFPKWNTFREKEDCEEFEGDTRTEAVCIY